MKIIIVGGGRLGYAIARQLLLENHDITAFRFMASVRLPVHYHVVVLVERVFHRGLFYDGRPDEIEHCRRQKNCDDDIYQKAFDKASGLLTGSRFAGVFVDGGAVPEVLAVLFVHSGVHIACFVSV